jgi:predicted ATP-grasp superfamily ATP-dependent carboligase
VTVATILVTDARLGSAVAVIRSLGARGHRVVAVDSPAMSAGLRSRHAWRAHRVPEPAANPRAFADRIAALVARYGVSLVVPVTDESAMALASLGARIGAPLATASDAALEVTRDKLATVRLASELDIAVPETIHVQRREDAMAAASFLGWPLVVKPRRSRVTGPDGRTRSMNVTYANAPDELSRAIDESLPLTDVLLQRYHAGTGIGVELLLHEGRTLAAFEHRRIREVPFTGGASAYRESVELDPGLLEHSSRLLERLQWTGLAMVEFKVDGEEAWLLEINGRIWGSLPLAVKSGMDFPARYVDLLLEGPPTDTRMATDYRRGVRSRHLTLELIWIAGVLGGRRRHPYLPAPTRADALRTTLDLLRPSADHDILSLSDPVPGLVDIVAATGHVARKAFGGG